MHCGCSLLPPSALPATPRHNRHTMCTTPLAPTSAPCSPPPALRCPSCTFHIHPFRPHWGFTSLYASLSLSRSRSQALSLSLAPSPSSPRGALGWRCNERCTLSSSCSRRRCFHSMAQSVSARLPARFSLRCALAGRPSVIQNKPKRMRREADAVAITSKYRYKCISSMHT